MFSRFFIDRPIFASVVSLVILLAGLVAYLELPVAQFPDVVPPVVNVSTSYLGADAKTLTDTVAIPIEQKVNGVDNMIYMNSSCSSDGTYTLKVYFDVGTDPDMSTVLVQNRVSLAEPVLPEEVQRVGISVQKQSTNMLGLYSLVEKQQVDENGQPKPRIRDSLYLSNYMAIFIKDELARIHGVGSADLMDAQDYSMRIWLDPDIMAMRNISVQDIQSVLREQNVQVASGSMGAEPSPKGQIQQLTITTQGRLQDESDFEEIVIRTDEEGRVLKLKDVARIELGKYSYTMRSFLDDRPSSSLAIYQSPGANAIEVRKNVEKKLEELKPMLDENGLEIVCAYDSTLFIETSIDEVKETLYIAILLVIGVVYIFLQDWRAALIPILTIPVSLVGCFGLMALFGFSLNTLTMFGLVLVIGIVVDDAIVVVENTQRILNAERCSSKNAAKKSMTEVSGPIVATTCVLCAVFIPTTFIGGMTGQLYTQFALTIVGAVVISALSALTISPALCAIFLRPETNKKFFFFRWFNWGFDLFSGGYRAILAKGVRMTIFIFILWCGLIAALYWGFNVMPSGFIPNEDQGVLFLDVRLPDGASLQRTMEVTQKMEKILSGTPGKENTLLISGYSMLSGTSSPNVMMGVVKLKPWNERSPEESTFVLQKKLMYELNMSFPEARTFVFMPPPIPGIGTSGGIECQLLDTRGSDPEILAETTQKLIDDSMKTGVFSNLTTTFQPNVPQLYLDIDREKVKKMDINLSELFASLQSYLGGAYINDFDTFERIFKVVVQADGEHRNNIDKILDIPLVNYEGNNLPLRSIATIKYETAPAVLNRFNMSASNMITANLAPGQSTGTGMAKLQELSK
ncbi:MAG: efflux RND transporter permease subunit, partial [Thermoguttaceae bacterium]|nr:efflux RND transporter permease subunit [Thermoguttaceae bacterium]